MRIPYRAVFDWVSEDMISNTYASFCRRAGDFLPRTVQGSDCNLGSVSPSSHNTAMLHAAVNTTINTRALFAAWRSTGAHRF